MSVRAKMKCQSKTETVYGIEVHLQPVHVGSDENKQFYRDTPGGDVRLSILNAPAAAAFTVGGEYYVDFTPV